MRCTLKQDTTRSLSRRLESIRGEREAEEFISRHASHAILSGYLNELIASHEVTIPELIERSGISRNYIYNILSGERAKPGRDKVVALCIGIGASFTELNRALELVKHAPLYPKDERDARIAIAVNRGMHRVTEVNLMLEKSGLAPLDV